MADISVDPYATAGRSVDLEGHAPIAAVSDYIDLLKPRVMSLVVFTGLTGLALAPGEIHPFIGFVAILCIAVGAGASGALNMWYDADIDAAMHRTARRPLPLGRVEPSEVLTLGIVLSVLSVLAMALAVNYVAAALLALTICFYLFVYTIWLKRRTSQNIVIGGAAGAFPPLIGWAAVTGTIAVEPIVLFLIIFLWTPPHFWALALYRKDDYARVGVPMLPVVAGTQSTRRHIVGYTAAMVAISLAPLPLGFAGWIYGIVAVASGAVFMGMSVRLWRLGDGRRADGKDAEKAARDVFAYSILYLFGLFAALLIEAIR
ncbi:MAG: heme o synthase [Pseudomonadota bacterium]